MLKKLITVNCIFAMFKWQEMTNWLNTVLITVLTSSKLHDDVGSYYSLSIHKYQCICTDDIHYVCVCINSPSDTCTDDIHYVHHVVYVSTLHQIHVLMIYIMYIMLCMYQLSIRYMY